MAAFSILEELGSDLLLPSAQWLLQKEPWPGNQGIQSPAPVLLLWLQVSHSLGTSLTELETGGTELNGYF